MLSVAAQDILSCTCIVWNMQVAPCTYTKKVAGSGVDVPNLNNYNFPVLITNFGFLPLLISTDANLVSYLNDGATQPLICPACLRYIFILTLYGTGFEMKEEMSIIK